MPATKAYSSLFPAGTSVPAGTTKTAPIVSSVVDGRTAYGGELTWRITNGGALGLPCIVMFQISSDQINWFDYQPVASADLLNATITQGPSIRMSAGGMYIRAIAYGNTTSACTVESGIQQVTGQ